MNGWVSINRSVCEHYLWKDKPFTKGQAWIDLIIHANHKAVKIEIKGKVYNLNRGQQARSELTLAKEWGWSRGKIRRFLKMLKSDLMIVQQAEQHTSIITICNYKDFQDQQQTDGTPKQTPNDTPSEHQTDTKRYTDNNVNKENNKVLAKKFDIWWEIYDKKDDKKQAVSMWNKLVKDHTLADIIILSTRGYVAANERQYRQTPFRWLRNEKWNDENEGQLINGKLVDMWEFGIQFKKEKGRWPRNEKYAYERKLSECPSDLRSAHADLFPSVN